MSTFNVKTYRAILSDMENWIIANQDIITDFNEGAIITSFCEATAQEIEQLYLRAQIGFIKYLPDMPFYAFGFTPLSGVKATGNVVFSRNVATAEAITIPIGTLISTPSGLLFETTTLGTIPISGTDSNSVSVQAQEIGTDYNVPASSITVLTTPLIGVDTVDNAASILGGIDDEDSNSFQQRFWNYILGLGKGNVYGLITGAKSVTGVHSVSVVEHFPPFTGNYNVSVYIEDGSGTASAELIASVLSILNGDGTAENPGYKAAGIKLRVLAPTLVTVDVVVTVTDTGNVDRAELEVAIKTAITAYINNLGLAEDVIHNRIIDEIMDVNGVYDLELTTPALNTSVGADQIARVINPIIVNFYSP